MVRRWPGDERKIRALAAIDPTGKQRWLEWAHQMWRHNPDVTVSRLGDLLARFYRVRDKLTPAGVEVAKLKNIRAAEAALAKLEGGDDGLVPPGARIAFQQGAWQIVEISDREQLWASCGMKPTKWCIGWLSDAEWNNYQRTGASIYLIHGPDKDAPFALAVWRAMESYELNTRGNKLVGSGGVDDVLAEGSLADAPSLAPVMRAFFSREFDMEKRRAELRAQVDKFIAESKAVFVPPREGFFSAAYTLRRDGSRHWVVPSGSEVESIEKLQAFAFTARVPKRKEKWLEEAVYTELARTNARRVAAPRWFIDALLTHPEGWDTDGPSWSASSTFNNATVASVARLIASDRTMVERIKTHALSFAELAEEMRATSLSVIEEDLAKADIQMNPAQQALRDADWRLLLEAALAVWPPDGDFDRTAVSSDVRNTELRAAFVGRGTPGWTSISVVGAAYDPKTVAPELTSDMYASIVNVFTQGVRSRFHAWLNAQTPPLPYDQRMRARHYIAEFAVQFHNYVVTQFSLARSRAESESKITSEE